MNAKHHIAVGAVAALLVGGVALAYYGRPAMKNTYPAPIAKAAVRPTVSPMPGTGASESRPKRVAETPPSMPTPSPAPTDASSSTGAAPAPSGYSLADVALHASANDCWTTINGSVYDLTEWIPRHPGGPQRIINICGRDGTADFMRQHGRSRRVAATLILYKIGDLT